MKSYKPNLTDSNSEFSVKDGVLIKYNGIMSYIKVPYGVETVGDRAFERCFGITDVELPDTVKKIGTGAFKDCYRLERVKLPVGLECIGMCAFDGCSSLKYIYTDDSVNTAGLPPLISIPESCLINSCDFLDCNSLMNEDGFLIINGCLYAARLGGERERLVIPDYIKAIDHDIFRGRNVHLVMRNREINIMHRHDMEGYLAHLATDAKESTASTVTLIYDDGSIAAKLIRDDSSYDLITGRRFCSVVPIFEERLNIREYDRSFLTRDDEMNRALMAVLHIENRKRFCHLTDWDNRRVIAALRLTYPLELSDESRRNYENMVNEDILQTFISMLDGGFEEDVISFARLPFVKESLNAALERSFEEKSPDRTVAVLEIIHRYLPEETL